MTNAEDQRADSGSTDISDPPVRSQKPADAPQALRKRIPFSLMGTVDSPSIPSSSGMYMSRRCLEPPVFTTISPSFIASADPRPLSPRPLSTTLHSYLSAIDIELDHAVTLAA